MLFEAKTDEEVLGFALLDLDRQRQRWINAVRRMECNRIMTNFQGMCFMRVFIFVVLVLLVKRLNKRLMLLYMDLIKIKRTGGELERNSS